MSFRMSCFFVEIIADVVVKKSIKHEMSKIFFIFYSIPMVGLIGDQDKTSIGLFYKNWGFYLEGD